MRAVWVFSALLGLTSGEALGGTVTSTGCGAGGCATLTDAVSKAAAGEVLTLSAGTFTESTTVAITKDLTIVGAGVGLTTVKANAGTSIVTVDGADVVIEDLSITSALANQRGIGGINLSGPYTVTARDVAFDTQVTAPNNGGAISAVLTDGLTLERVSFTGTAGVASAQDGGAIYATSSSGAPVTLTDVTFDHVESLIRGGAMFADGVDLTCDGCVFASPTTILGAGIYAVDTSLTVAGSRFCGGSASLGGAIYGEATDGLVVNTVVGQNSGSAVYLAAGAWEIRNNTFLGNFGRGAVEGGTLDALAVTSNVFLDSDQWAVNTDSVPEVTYNWFEDSGFGNVEGLPLLDGTNFQDVGYLGDLLFAWNGDCINDLVYPTPLTSPLIDTGDPAWADPDGSISDIGAYGGPDADPAVHFDGDSDGASVLRDCDDADSALSPDADEVCDLVDNDCDALVDDDDPFVADQGQWYPDCDGDGQGDMDVLIASCAVPTEAQCAGVTVWVDAQLDPDGGADCDDTNPLVYYGADERCSLTDGDCDGIPSAIDDPVDGTTYYTDEDGDGYGTIAVVRCSATAPPGTAPLGGDCDDQSTERNPGQLDTCGDGIDQDCTGGDGSLENEWYPDDDDDGYGDAFAAPVYDCGDLSPAYTNPDDATDCDDGDEDVFPGAVEVCNLVDDDCNAQIDDAGPLLTWYLDDDGDGFGDEQFPVVDECPPEEDWIDVGDDCDDADADVSPAADEICNDGTDDDCDGLRDVEDDTLTDGLLLWPDADGDGYGGCGEPGLIECDPTVVCDPTGYVDRAGDCQDLDAAISPDATEVPDNDIDEDCSDGRAQTPPVEEKPGCNCASDPSPAGSLALLLMGVVMVRRRR